MVNIRIDNLISCMITQQMTKLLESPQKVEESVCSLANACIRQTVLMCTIPEAIYVPGRGKPKNRDALIQETLT